MLLHIPHGSTLIPENERQAFVAEYLESEMRKMTDWGVDRIFNVGNKVEFAYSRLFCDVERFASGDSMENIGMGVCYTHTSDGLLMREVSRTKRKEIMKKYYWPHHHKLERAVAEEVARYGRCLIIDCHSFPGKPLPYEKDSLRPDFCIGFDCRCRGQAMELAALLEAKGYDVGINRPFAGALMPEVYFDDSRVVSVMIEVNRDLVYRKSAITDMNEVLRRTEKSFYSDNDVYLHKLKEYNQCV